MNDSHKNKPHPFLEKKEIISDQEGPKVQVIHNTARSKREYERLKDLLENKGFKLYGKEYDAENEEDYYATIHSEKQLPLTREDIHYRKAANFYKKREKKVNLAIKFMWWILILVAFLVFLYLARPWIETIKMFF